MDSEFDFVQYQELQQPFNQEQVIRIEEGEIVHIWSGNNQNGLVTISYDDRANRRRNELVALVITPQTVMQDSAGRRIRLNELRIGMKVNAIFSSRMTRSIPPQALAFLVVVLDSRDQNRTVTGTVVNVDRRNNLLEIRRRDRDGRDNDGRGRDDWDDDRDGRGDGRRDDDRRQDRMTFRVTNTTLILDRRGRRINFGNLRRDDRVRVDFIVSPQPRPQRINIATQIQLL